MLLISKVKATYSVLQIKYPEETLGCFKIGREVMKGRICELKQELKCGRTVCTSKCKINLIVHAIYYSKLH